MKTEKFEDQIRKKLESIEPEFTEKDWVNFSEYSTSKLATSAKIFSSTIFKMAASVAILGTLFISLAQYKINNDLKEKVQNLASQNEQLLSNQKQLEKIISSENNISKNNTQTNKADETIITENNLKLNEKLSDINSKNNLEIANNEKVSAKNNEKAINKNNQKTLENAIGKTENKSEFLTNNNKNRLKYNGPKTKNTIFENDLNEANQISEKGILVKNELEITGNYNNKKVKKSGKSGKNSEYSADLSPENQSEQSQFSNISNINNSNEKSINNLNYSYLANKDLKIDSSKKLQKMLRKGDFAYYKINTEKKKAYFTLADAYLRTGISGSLSTKGASTYGLNAELFLDQRVSVSTGIYTMNHKLVTYLSPDHYKFETHKDFKEQFKDRVPSQRQVLDITEKRQIMVVPVHINYNHPMANNFKIVASAGSELDINGTSSMNYKLKKGGFLGGPFQPPTAYSEEIELEKFTNKLDTKVFNNLYLALGAEKQFGKLAIQAKVYDNFLVKDVTDYRRKNRIGTEIGLFYRL